MQSEWPEVTLLEIADPENGAVDGPFGSNLPASSYVETGIPVIRGSNLSVGLDRFNSDNFVYVSHLTFEKLKRSGCLSEDIIFTKKGTLGQTGIIPSDRAEFDQYLLSSNQMRLRVNKQKAYPLFVYYAVSSCESIERIKRDSEYTGVPKINLDYLKKFTVTLPPLHEQKAIAHILGSLDDKIELNRQMNATLEAMAQALFKSWFVDFDPVLDNALAAGNPIPDELEAKAAAREALGDAGKPLPEDIAALFPAAFVWTEEMGWIPEGWGVGEIGSILERMTIKKRYKKNDVVSHGRTPVYEQGASILLGYHEGEAEIEASIDNPAFIFGDHTCVTKLSCEPFSISENVIPLKGNKYPTTWVYFAVQGKQSFEEYRRHWMELIVKTTILPPYKLTHFFVKSTNDVLRKQIAITRENSTLEQLRDALLPKLLSGELRIPDAEKLVGEAIA